MFKLNRMTEYGIISLRHIGRKNATDPSSVTSAREISDFYGLPFEVTAKTLQKLTEHGLIQSAHGARGGYTLQRPLGKISLGEFVELMEGPVAIVMCSGENHSEAAPATCEYGHRCEIKGMMSQLNNRIQNFLSGIPLAEIAAGFDGPPTKEGAST